ncbi:hypothetical protein [Pseudomonas sp. EMN2]|uniref:hypothetical protein n=1 Tax=Pseudomonas sp. EMN2 TaxID=2615212 RepID=UPI00129A56E7|nr:hypothetical protein [Pseudomonas sp. EMN2]
MSQLKTFTTDAEDGSRTIVATTSPTRASKLLGVKFAEVGTASASDECELALSDPGAVWRLQPGGSSWKKISNASKAASFPPQGGVRPGAGRTTGENGPVKIRSVRLDDVHHGRLMSYGGTEYLRNVLDAELPLDADEWKALGEKGVDWIRAQLKPTRTKAR